MSWTLKDDRLTLKHLFDGKGTTSMTVNDVKNVEWTTLEPSVEKQLRQTESEIKTRWSLILKPIILSHLSGNLHYNWKKCFALYLIDQRVSSAKDIY
jgi:hypothetical protein